MQQNAVKKNQPAASGAAFAQCMADYRDGRFAEALAGLKPLLVMVGKPPENWYALLGNIHFKLGNRDSAAEAFVNEADLYPGKAGAYLKLALTLSAENPAMARRIGARALALNPGDPAMAYMVVDALILDGKFAEAEPLLPLLNDRDPKHVALAVSCHRSLKNREKAYEVLCDGITACPQDWFLKIVHHADARPLCDFETMRDYRRIMETPDSPEASILLSGEMALNRLYWNASEALNAAPSYDQKTLEGTIAGQGGKASMRRGVSPAGGKLRIGYLSNDFADHVVTSVFMEALAAHDPERFEIMLFCYTHPQWAEKARRNWPANVRDGVVPIGHLCSRDAADLIDSHGTDILIDLKGHTAAARLDIVSLSTAPVKCTYLGYPASVTGADFDYFIGDRMITPDDAKPFFREKLCRLPETSMPNKRLETVSPQPADRRDWGLPEDRIVFASFNATYKISLKTAAMWGRILAALPEAVLWIRCDGDATRRNLLGELARYGVARDQVLFAEETASYQDHITRLALADLALDTAPYNGHATTTDMLRAGLPVVALRGTSCASRMSEALLSSVGMPDMVADDEDAYCALAIRLAREPHLIETLKTRLRQNAPRAPLFNPARLAAHLERAFEMMAERARQNLAPDHIDVPALDSLTAADRRPE